MNICEQSSFAYFVYPFAFAPEDFDRRMQMIDAVKRGGRKEEKRVWIPAKFPQDDLLSHVIDYLDPEPSDGSSPTTRLWTLNNEVGHEFGFSSQWQWELYASSWQVGCKFGEQGKGSTAIQLALFRVGIGFLTILARPDSKEVNDWLNFLHYFRYVRGQRSVKVERRRKKGKDRWERDNLQILDELITELLGMGAEPGERERQHVWWQEVFVPGKMLPFAALYADRAPEAELPLLRYRLHNFFNAKQGGHATSAQLSAENSAFLPYARNQWFSFSLEGGSYLACDAPKDEFFRNTLPDRLRKQYYLLFLLTLHQRFCLLEFSDAVARSWRIATASDDFESKLVLLEELRDRLLLFTARGFFSQAMQIENHHRYYCKWQEIFILERLYREVNDEVREMQEYARLQSDCRIQEQLRAFEAGERQRDLNLNRTVLLASLGFGFASLAASTSGLMTVSEPVTVKWPSFSGKAQIHPLGLAILWTLCFGVLGLTIGWLLDFLFRQNARNAEARKARTDRRPRSR